MFVMRETNDIACINVSGRHHLKKKGYSDFCRVYTASPFSAILCWSGMCISSKEDKKVEAWCDTESLSSQQPSYCYSALLGWCFASQWCSFIFNYSLI